MPCLKRLYLSFSFRALSNELVVCAWGCKTNPLSQVTFCWYLAFNACNSLERLLRAPALVMSKERDSNSLRATRTAWCWLRKHTVGEGYKKKRKNHNLFCTLTSLQLTVLVSTSIWSWSVNCNSSPMMSVWGDDGGITELLITPVPEEMWGWLLYCSGRLSHPHFWKNLNTTKKCLHGILHCIQSGHVREGSPVVVSKLTVCSLLDDPLIVNIPAVVS